MDSNSTRGIIIACAAAGAGVLLALAAYGYWRAHSAPQTLLGASVADAPSALVPAPAPRTPPAGYKEFMSAQYHFSLFYQDTLLVQQYDEGAGASTIVFQNVQTAQGFQIFIVPYGLPQVSAEEFKKDEPSGVRDGLKNVSIDGVAGASFYGQDAALGDTAEVWVIRSGYLYETTTLKPLAGWMSAILQTWNFL